MATLTIKNLPDDIYTTLSKTAKRNRRSLNSEAIVRLEQSVRIGEADVEVTLQSIRKMRAKLREKGVWLTDEILEQAKNEGRP